MYRLIIMSIFKSKSNKKKIKYDDDDEKYYIQQKYGPNHLCSINDM